MKKVTALVALALLAIAGTGYAVTCAQDNVPAATLLVPYFRVGGTGVTGSGTNLNPIPSNSGTDTLVAVTNVSSQSIIIHVTVWNKYSVPVLDFNVPMTGFDVVFWGMRSILNGHLNVNYDPVAKTGVQIVGGNGTVGKTLDPCGQDTSKPIPANAAVKTVFTRFAPTELNDSTLAISVYKDPAFDGAFRSNVWTSLDESGDITDWLGNTLSTPGTGFIIDADNYACTGVAGTTISGDFSGYLTIDVANYCTQHFPTDVAYWTNDAIATNGWGGYPGVNILMGDIFYVDGAPSTVAGGKMGNISGDPAVQIEFDSRLRWVSNLSIPGIDTGSKTFYGRYFTSKDTGVAGGAAAPFAFMGDGREPLGQDYGFRYMQSASPSIYSTWINVWRSDYYPGSTDNGVSQDPTVDLCGWWGQTPGLGLTGYAGDGFTDVPTHKIGLAVYDNDEGTQIGSGGPSGGPTTGQLYVFLETQRLVVTPNAVVVPTSFYGGWIQLSLPGNAPEQAYVGVQHSGLGLAMSVGHSATLLTGEGVCVPQQVTTFPGALRPVPTTLDTGLPVQTGSSF